MNWGVVLSAAMLTVGCQAESAARCRLPPEPIPSGPRDSVWAATMANYCVHKNAYLLARGPDSAEAVADAVMTRCADIISTLARTTDPQQEGINAFQAFQTILRREAVVRIIEARAGDCNA